MFVLMIFLSAWPEFMHDAQHTGRSPVVVQDSLEVGWIYNHPSGSSWIWAEPVLDDQGNIYYGSGNYFVAVDSSGSQRWSKYTSHVFAGPAAVVGDTVYFGCSEGYLSACHLDGTEIWQFPLVHPMSGGPVIGEGGVIYIGDAYQPNYSRLYAINPDGTQKWVVTFDSSDACYTTPALDPAGDYVYITPGNWYLYAIDASSGDTVWRYRSAASFNVQYSSPSVLDLGTKHRIFFGDLGNLSGYAYWYCIKKDGSLDWRVQTGNSIQNTASFGSDHTIYLGDNDGVLRAVDTTGQVKWQKTFGCNISDPTVDGKDQVLVGTENGYLNVLDGANGNTIQQINLGMSNVSTPVIGADGRVYVIAGGGDLVCLRRKIGIAEGKGMNLVSVRVFPNPASERFHIRQDHGRIARIRIYDPIGRAVYSGFLKGGLDWRPLDGRPGVYFLECRIESGEVIREKLLFLNH